MHSAELFGIILVGLIFLIVSHLLILDILYQSFYTPLSIYNESRMNWFGTIIIYILMFPFSFVLAIGGFLRWAFTVGRKY